MEPGEGINYETIHILCSFVLYEGNVVELTISSTGKQKYKIHVIFLFASGCLSSIYG